MGDLNYRLQPVGGIIARFAVNSVITLRREGKRQILPRTGERMKNHSDELIFHSLGLCRSAANQGMAGIFSKSMFVPEQSERKEGKYAESTVWQNRDDGHANDPRHVGDRRRRVGPEYR